MTVTFVLGRVEWGLNDMYLLPKFSNECIGVLGHVGRQKPVVLNSMVPFHPLFSSVWGGHPVLKLNLRKEKEKQKQLVLITLMTGRPRVSLPL